MPRLRAWNLPLPASLLVRVRYARHWLAPRNLYLPSCRDLHFPMAAASHRVGKALVLREQGGPDAFTVESAWPASEPAEGEILVRLAATSVNPVDTYHRSGSHGHKLARVPEVCAPVHRTRKVTSRPPSGVVVASTPTPQPHARTRPPQILGGDVAGTVVAAGEGAKVRRGRQGAPSGA